MRLLTFFILITCSAVPCFGQQHTFGWEVIDRNIHHTNPDRAPLPIDTLDDYLVRATSITAIAAQDGGYVFGTGFEDVGQPFGIIRITQETGNHYDAVGEMEIIEVLVMFVDTIIVGSPDTIQVRIHKARADSMPKGALLGSGLIATSDINLTGFTSIPITNGSTYLDEDFFVSLKYTNVNDTFGIAANDPAFNDGQGEQRTRCKLDGLTYWIRAWELFDSLDADAMIIPVVNELTGIGKIAIDDVTLHTAFPNPATDYLTIPYTAQSDQQVRLTVFDITGKVYADRTELATGHIDGAWHLNISHLSDGPYYYTISSGKSRVTRKFLIAR